MPVCLDCGRPVEGACFDCPLARYRLDGAGEAPLHFVSPLAWDVLTPRGRKILRLLVGAPILARQQNLSPEACDRGIRKLLVRATLT